MARQKRRNSDVAEMGVRDTSDASPSSATKDALSRTTRRGPNVKETTQARTAAATPKLTEIAYQKLLNAIVQGRLEFGEPLSENDLACALNLSKAPIRESLKELRLRGLVEVVPRSGSYVFSPTAGQIAELCDYRILLESNALRIAMELHPRSLLAALKPILTQMKAALRGGDAGRSNELDKEFHMSIVGRSDNRYLIESYENIGLTVEALRYRVMSTTLYRSKVQDEHTNIVELLAEGQTNKAVRLLESHIQRVKRVQSTAEWGPGRLPRRNYKSRDFAEILM